MPIVVIMTLNTSLLALDQILNTPPACARMSFAAAVAGDPGRARRPRVVHGPGELTGSSSGGSGAGPAIDADLTAPVTKLTT